MQEIQGLAVPVAPEGNALIQTVEDMQSQTRLKVGRARLAVADTVDLLAEDLLTGTYWLDLRKAHDAALGFGTVPTAVWTAFRKTVPFGGPADAAASEPIHELAAAFIRSHPPSTFYADDGREPEGRSRPRATAK
jgi:histidine ammonia-lyase